MPSPLVTHQSDEYSFDEFSSQPFYRRVNSHLVDMSGVFNHHKIIDLGCGTGGITKLILDRLSGTKETVIYAVDHSASALRSAVDELGDRKEAAVRFVHAEVQNLASSVNEQVDAVIYCNSIHYVNDKVGLLSQIRERLKPGGILAFNTSFFEGSHPPESHDFYRRWMMRSLRTLRRSWPPMEDDSNTAPRGCLSCFQIRVCRARGAMISSWILCVVERHLTGPGKRYEVISQL